MRGKPARMSAGNFQIEEFYVVAVLGDSMVNATAPIERNLLFHVLGIDLAPVSPQILNRLGHVTCISAFSKFAIPSNNSLCGEMLQHYCNDNMAQEVEDVRGEIS
jgi:hypothetical protein